MRIPGTVLAALLTFALGFTMWDRLIDRMIFQPTGGADLRPEQLGIVGEDVFLETEDAVRIHSYYLPGLPGLPARAGTRALLFLHGNAGNASHRLPNAAELAMLDCNVLLLDYRGYGLSEGRPSESGVYADARAGLRYLVEALELPESRIVVFGRSLGGAVAVDLARNRHLAGVVLESTFSSASDLARTMMGTGFGLLAGSRFDSIAKIDRVKAPLLFFHGDRDRVVDHALGRRLYEIAPEPKAFETIAGAGHNDTTQIGGRRYFRRIREFLDEVAPIASRPEAR
jgi:fermentation-respiration switch protein FrsA (DUF1100 family)